MSNTIVDMPKVTQMLDSGWRVAIWRGGMGSYVAQARHKSLERIRKANEAIIKLADKEMGDVVRDTQDDDRITTDDFTPEQALTRLAYKVHGEIL